jgi:vacuolar-type H+-ATPase subunit F/Vma7
MGEIRQEARKFARHVVKDSNLEIILIDRPDLEAIRENPSHIASVLIREAKRAMTMKKLISGKP